MDVEYSVEVVKELEDRFRETALHRPMRVERFEPGTELVYDVTDVIRSNRGRVHLVVDKFVGGGFAGQVYRVKILDIEVEDGPIEGLDKGGIFAMKILIPPSGFSLLFRNALYRVGFQGPFQLQLNPAAARSGALWQKFIRRGAKMRFGEEGAVVDIYATFVDYKLGSCGELSEWVEGRTWRLEVDEHLDILNRWTKGKEVKVEDLGSPEYRAKREFMDGFVELLHHMGGHEFARQYEWSTWKSQPNCLKRNDSEGFPSTGLVAVDFRAGLALLPFLPMSPGDFKLIAKGLMRGSLVQFDRGDIEKLEQFTETHGNEFDDMSHAMEELKRVDRVYRDSAPDITYNRLRLFYRSGLWSTILDSAVTGWKIKGIIDEDFHNKLRDNRPLTFLFCLMGFIPFLGRFLRRIRGHVSWRRHYMGMLSSREYFRRAVRGRVIEKVIGWHRSGRVDGERAGKIAGQPWRSLYHIPFSVLPGVLHRCITDWQYTKERIDNLIFRPVRLYFNEDMREQWLRDMVEEGRRKHLLSNEDADVILSQVKEPFIQKYLKSLAVHLCTLPVTQIVSLLVAIIYVVMHPDMPRGQAYGMGLGIIALFQVTPISPGSLVRGLYVLYLVIRERNFKDYNIAVFLGFFKYVGYLAFPIQMAYRYPTLARFMAGHWATEAVHVVPVFGERGALLEHKIFSLFYNRPLTIRRKMRNRARMRAEMRPRYRHIIPCVIAGTGLFTLADFVYIKQAGEIPGLKEIWWLAVIVPLLCGAVVTLGARGAEMGKRIIGAACCGGAVGILYATASTLLNGCGSVAIGEMVTNGVWRVFLFTIMSIIGALLTEIGLPEKETE